MTLDRPDPDALTSASGRSIPQDNVIAFTQAVTNTWGVAGAGYAQDKFYCAATDHSSKQSASFKVAVPASMAAQMSALVQAGLIPEYHTSQDIIRDALHHRLEFLSTFTGKTDMARVMNMNRRVANLEARSQELEALAGFVDQIEAAFKLCKTHRDRESGEHVVQVTREEMVGMAEPWRTRVHEVLRDMERWLEEIRGEEDG